MSGRTFFSRPRRRLVALLALAVLSFAAVALAAGRVQWKTTTLKPNSDFSAWLVEVTFFLNKAPDVALVPFKFEFTPTVYYERAKVDGDKIIERKVPLTGQRELIETVDVGFLDPSNGQTQKRTRFSFKITRARGFEAGEYSCIIRDTRNGQAMGGATRIIFEGENTVIDRRTITFAGGDGKKKQMKKVDKDGEIKDDTAKPEGTGGTGGGSSAPSGSAGAKDDGDESIEGAGDPNYEVPTSKGASGKDPWSEGAQGDGDSPPQEIKDKPGGCGCRAAGVPQGGSALVLAGLFGLAAARRRRAAQL